jgi:hypothetical protein
MICTCRMYICTHKCPKNTYCLTFENWTCSSSFPCCLFPRLYPCSARLKSPRRGERTGREAHLAAHVSPPVHGRSVDDGFTRIDTSEGGGCAEGAQRRSSPWEQRRRGLYGRHIWGAVGGRGEMLWMRTSCAVAMLLRPNIRVVLSILTWWVLQNNP